MLFIFKIKMKFSFGGIMCDEDIVDCLGINRILNRFFNLGHKSFCQN